MKLHVTEYDKLAPMGAVPLSPGLASHSIKIGMGEGRGDDLDHTTLFVRLLADCDCKVRFNGSEVETFLCGGEAEIFAVGAGNPRYITAEAL